MILVEQHTIKFNNKNKELFERIDSFCYASKNLRNYTNYIIKQCSRISYKLKQGEILDSWEKGLIYRINCAIKKYNSTRPDKKPLKSIDDTNSFVADAYFLSWYLKDFDVYKQMPMATTAQICIQNICKDWKAFYKGMQAWKKNSDNMLGKPNVPKYYDKETGRNWIVLTNQLAKVNKNNRIELPKAFGGINVKFRHTNLQQVRVITTKTAIKINLCYKKDDSKATLKSNKNTMAIDIGVNNMATVTFSDYAEPIIIDGREIKSHNQWYNKEKARLQEMSKVLNNRYDTSRMDRLTQRRNNKVKDYMHKASRMIVNLAIQNNVGQIVIGNNQGWKQEVHIGKKNNQNFVNIPYDALIKMITYKAKLQGMVVTVTDEKYTSGTSYLDGEEPTKENYKKARRKHRGLFVSNRGISINADVNGSYQIMKKIGMIPPIKPKEKVVRLKVA